MGYGFANGNANSQQLKRSACSPSFLVDNGMSGSIVASARTEPALPARKPIEAASGGVFHPRPLRMRRLVDAESDTEAFSVDGFADAADCWWMASIKDDIIIIFFSYLFSIVCRCNSGRYGVSA